MITRLHPGRSPSADGRPIQAASAAGSVSGRSQTIPRQTYAAARPPTSGRSASSGGPAGSGRGVADRDHQPGRRAGQRHRGAAPSGAGSPGSPTTATSRGPSTQRLGDGQAPAGEPRVRRDAAHPASARSASSRWRPTRSARRTSAARPAAAPCRTASRRRWGRAPAARRAQPPAARRRRRRRCRGSRRPTRPRSARPPRRAGRKPRRTNGFAGDGVESEQALGHVAVVLEHRRRRADDAVAGDPAQAHRRPDGPRAAARPRAGRRRPGPGDRRARPVSASAAMARPFHAATTLSSRAGCGALGAEPPAAAARARSHRLALVLRVDVEQQLQGRGAVLEGARSR